METKLERISQLSKENPNMVFTSIGHLINKDMLKSCHESMDKDKAVGIDGVTKEDYGANLDENLDKLVERLKKHSYKPKPARRRKYGSQTARCVHLVSTATRINLCKRLFGEYSKQCSNHISIMR